MPEKNLGSRAAVRKSAMPMVDKSRPAPLLLEIGSEELPPNALGTLGEALGRELHAALAKQDLLADEPLQSKWEWYATPRRLAVLISNVRRRQPNRTVERRGPSLQAAFAKDGNPTRAAEGFAQSCDTTVTQLKTLETDAGAWLVYRRRLQGRTARRLIPECVADAVQRLPIPKRMRWGKGDAEFVRPVHWIVLIHGADVVDAKLFSIKTGNVTFGHRFHHPKPRTLRSAQTYADVLESKCYVIADFATRRKWIHAQVSRLAGRKKALVVTDDDLLNEATALVEWPRAILGDFDKEFLKIPEEVLISSMREHQKYFPLATKHGRLLPHFITVSNIESKNPNRVREGNERVLRARLTDAVFFWETDRKTRLDARTDELRQVLFHSKLGSVHDKTVRTAAIARHVAGLVNADQVLVDRAAGLLKADLVTDMVGEFPRLQGTMGRYYALSDDEHPEVAEAIEEHYLPRFAGDGLPKTRTGQIVAIADKLDTLVGVFAAQEEPSGDKDPYALRRAALGILRIAIETPLEVDLKALVDHTMLTYRRSTDSLSKDIQLQNQVGARVLEFILERLHSYYQSAGFGADEIAAVAACHPTSPMDFDRRLRAVAVFRKHRDAPNLAAVNKRIRNILRQAQDEIPDRPDDQRTTEAAERQLMSALQSLGDEVSPYLAAGDYAQTLTKLATLRKPVDKFFDEVMVMVDDPKVRVNRLAILKSISDLFLQVADVSRLQS